MHIYVFGFSQLQQDVVENDKFRKESAFSLCCYLHYELNNPLKLAASAGGDGIKTIAEGEQTLRPSVGLFLILFTPLTAEFNPTFHLEKQASQHRLHV